MSGGGGGVELLTPCFVPRGRVLYIMIVPGEGFAHLSSIPGGGDGFG